MTPTRTPSLARNLPLIARATVFLVAILLLAAVQLHTVAPSLRELGPDLVAEPDIASGEPNAVVLWVWDALPVFSQAHARPGPFAGVLSGRAKARGELFD